MVRALGWLWLPVLLGGLGCSPLVVDAVSGGSCAEDPTLPDCSSDVWPVARDRANSSDWLRANHDRLVEIRPRVLVLDYYNGRLGGPKFTVDQMRQFVERQIDALAEGSRYHGYADPTAPAFLKYQLVGIVDLTDPDPADSPFSSSTKLPLTSSGAFDVAALFTPEYAEIYGIESPSNPGTPLTLCQLFETGEINELWLAVTDATPLREPPSMLECKAVYDASGNRVPDEFVELTGYNFCALAAQCGVTVRIAHLSVERNVGCDLQVRGWGIHSSTNAIDYLSTNARHYFNTDLAERYASYNLPFNSLSQICRPRRSGERGCVEYPDPTSAHFTDADIIVRPYEQGCGTSDYPPNAGATWDWASEVPVQARCASYGIPGGAPEIYQNSTLPDYEPLLPDLPGDTEFIDCGGAWQLYWRQNIPGLGNPARAADGTSMKNWWPFLFY